MIAQTIKKNSLAIIIVFYLLIALTGIFYDWGLNTVGDETPLMNATLKMISDHTLRPNYQSFYHVPLAVYLYLPFFILFLLFLRLSGLFPSLAAIKEFGIIDANKFLPWARFLTVLLGAFSLYLLYKICQKLFNNKAIALLASLLLSSSLMFVQMSHFARVWLPQLAAVLLAFYFIVVLYRQEHNKIKDYLWAGFSIGLAMGTHVIGVLIYASFVATHLIKNQSKKLINIYLNNKYFWSANFLIVLFYFLILFLNPRGFHNYLNRDGGILPNFNFLFASTATSAAANLGFFSSIFHPWEKFYYYPGILVEYEPILALLFILGAIVLFIKERKIFYLIFSFILFYYIGVSFAGLEPRYILPLIPFIALVAAYGIYFFYQKSNHLAAGIIISLIIFLNFIPPLIWDYHLTQESTFRQARSWIYSNIPAGEKIINFDLPLELNENKQAITDIKNTLPQFNKKRAYLLSLNESRYPQPNYYIFYFSYYENIPAEILNNQYDYLIISWWDKADLLAKQARLPKLNLQQEMVLFKKFPRDATDNNFSMNLADMRFPVYNLLFKIKQTGPTIYIYKLE